MLCVSIFKINQFLEPLFIVLNQQNPVNMVLTENQTITFVEETNNLTTDDFLKPVWKYLHDILDV